MPVKGYNNERERERERERKRERERERGGGEGEREDKLPVTSSTQTSLTTAMPGLSQDQPV